MGTRLNIHSADCSIMTSTFFLALLAVSGAFAAQASYSGGLAEIDVNHHTVQDLVKLLPSMSNDLDGLEIVRVVRAHLQVVAGMRYVLTLEIRGKGSNGPATQECEADVWIQSWLERRTLTKFTCKPLLAYGALGGWREVSVDDAAKKAANVALELINGKCNCMFRRIISRITKVQRKVVAGVLQRITFELINSSCRNTKENQWKNLQDCPALENAQAKECEITILWQPWISPEYRLVSHTC